MQTVINIFTIIGSILGVFAFFISILSPLHDYNSKKWKDVSKIINLNEFEKFCNGASYGEIYTDVSDKFKDLVDLIRIQSEHIQFKGIISNRIKHHFSEILKLADLLFDEVQVPKWNVWKDTQFIELKLDKEYIEDISNSQKERDKINRESIEKVTTLIEKIMRHYRRIYILSNRLPYEYLFR